ncbi:MAG: hypothetical protein M3O02_08135 [Acidobacteriota bacterium]|nr:hypothetical protein [Acidobacteriota bacterium]
MNTLLDPQTGRDAHAGFARAAIRSIPVAARGVVVNRTHRVVRERARVLRERRTRVRSLITPMLLCAVLLTLCVLAVWTGMYQYQAVEAMEADVATLDLNNHAIVALLWFVPVSLAVMAAVWARRGRHIPESEAR